MTKTVKDRLINLTLVIVSGVTVSLLTSYTANRHEEKKDFTKDIRELRELKADRTELNDFKIEVDNKIEDSENRIIKHQDKRFDDVIKMIEILHDKK
jgi:hypothetical protein